MNYRKKIKIGKNVTDIMRLPCIFSCHKELDGRLCYLLYDWDEYGNYVEARTGDLLLESADGKWSVKHKGDDKK